MRRRNFITSLAATTLVGCKDDGDDKPDITDDIELDVGDVMRAYFGDEQIANARKVGSAYGRRFENNDVYAADLDPVLDIIGESETVDEAVEALRAQVDADFNADEMVLVDGWALGGTEARLGATADYVEA